MEKEYSDEEIARLLDRDTDEAFRQIYRKYARLLVTIAYRYVGDYDQAKDILQEAIYKAFTKRKSFKYTRGQALLAWLKRIVINESINHLKSFNVKMTQRYEEEIELSDEDETEDTSLLRSLEPQVLLELIARLPDGYRVVLSMYALEGYSHKEIAEQLGIKERTSSSQYYRAKQELKKLIEEWKINNI
ncbi:MAG: RNA polymerase sigma factor [Porphyromonas sp.]|nr:RNA polymerase sigma factor [Porphyromonas sp.]